MQHYYGDLAADDFIGGDDQPPLIFLHGLGFNRGHWAPVIGELTDLAPGRRMVSFDLPGHGASPARDCYDGRDLAAVLHDSVRKAGLRAPVVVGHSFGGVLATVYAAMYPSSGVVNVDQPLLPGNFATMLRDVEPVLRSPRYLEVWKSLMAGMHAEQLPPDVRGMVLDAPAPGQDLLLGYWRELLTSTADGLAEQRMRDLAILRSNRTPYRYLAGDEPPAAYQRWLRSMLPDVAITVLPGSGHFPHLARAAEVAAILAKAESK
jgi:pimeloyl-ACP methyl ester carboxylesterase